MKKISREKIIETILNEAKIIKRKKELFEEAKKINTELKKLNEYGHPGAMLGFGFKNSNSPSPILGLSTQSNYEIDNSNQSCDCELDQFSSLEKDMKDLSDSANYEIENDIDSLRAENEELKKKLAQIQGIADDLNEGVLDKLKAGFKGIKAGMGAAVKAGKEAGQQQYQKTRQSQELENLKSNVSQALMKKMSELNKNGKIVNPNDISNVLKNFNLKYIGKKHGGPKIVSLAEGEEQGIEEINEMFGKTGAMIGGAMKQVGNDIKGALEPIKKYGEKLGAAAQSAGKNYDDAQIEKQKVVQDRQQKILYNQNRFDLVLNALKNYQIN